MSHTCVNTFASPTSAIFPVPSLVSKTLCDFRSNSLQQTQDNCLSKETFLRCCPWQKSAAEAPRW